MSSDYEDDGVISAVYADHEVRRMLWSFFDMNRDKRIKLKWGFFRPTFKISQLEPLFAKLIGPRPT